MTPENNEAEVVGFRGVSVRGVVHTLQALLPQSQTGATNGPFANRLGNLTTPRALWYLFSGGAQSPPRQAQSPAPRPQAA